jgi:hypothetical protein
MFKQQDRKAAQLRRRAAVTTVSMNDFTLRSVPGGCRY